jgi:hypothetical protein
MTSRTRAGEAAQALVLAAVMLPLFVAVVGLAIDGGIVLGARRELQSVADAAARAGAMQIDQRVYRASAGSRVVLDEASARQAAAMYLAEQPGDLEARVETGPERIVVRVGREVPTGFLRIVGIGRVFVGAVAPAEVRYGVERGNR